MRPECLDSPGESCGANGRLRSASEVIREALRLLESHDRALDQGLAQLRADVDAGLRQLDEGNTSPFDKAAVERIKRRGREKLAELKSAKA